jgi:uncharacterized membrane protein YfcA
VEFLLGFLIACAVGLTGVGAGSVTAPVLILFFHMKPAIAVGTALTFSSAIKFAVLPLYLKRKQVDFRILKFLCLGGIPGVLIGVRILSQMDTKKHEGGIFLVLGTTIFIVSMGSLYRTIRNRMAAAHSDHAFWLPPIAAIIGGEVGFSSAGAGALGALVLLNLTTLTAAQVVGTDMVFGFTVSTIGGGLHLIAGQYDKVIMIKLIVGGVAGAFTGALLSSVIPPRPLRLVLSIWLAILGLQLCWKALT